MVAFFSGVSPRGDASQEYVEVTAEAGTDLSRFAIALYDRAGTHLDSFRVGKPVAAGAGHDIYRLDCTSTHFNSSAQEGNIWEGDALALVDRHGRVIQFLSFSGTPVSAADGPAGGMTSRDAGTVAAGEALFSEDGGRSYARRGLEAVG